MSQIPASAVPDATCTSDQYKMARAQIEHENILIGQRITWYLTFQGLLFAALFVAVGLFDRSKKFGMLERQHIAVAVYVLGFLGLSSSVVCFALIRAAYAQIGAVEFWWKELQCSASAYPPLAGTGGRKVFGYHFTAADFLLALCIVWVFLMALFGNVARQVA